MSAKRKTGTCIDCRIAIHGKSTRCRSCFGRTCRKPPRFCDGCGAVCKPGAMRCLPCSNRLRRTKRVDLCPDCGKPFSGRRAKRCHKCEVTRHSTRHKQHDEIWALYELGLPISEIARRLGVSKNTISGYAWRQGWTRRSDYLGPTSMDRLQALQDALDAAKAEYDTKYAAGLLTLPKDAREAA